MDAKRLARIDRIRLGKRAEDSPLAFVRPVTALDQEDFHTVFGKVGIYWKIK